MNRAIKNNHFIESICLLSNAIDGLLRTALILKEQLENKNSVINEKWIHQGVDDPIIVEKTIYKNCLKNGIIDTSIYEELIRLYDERNKVIHRFIISEITLSDVEKIAMNYSEILKDINQIVYILESEQIDKSVGMSVVSSGKDQKPDLNLNNILSKFGNRKYIEEL